MSKVKEPMLYRIPFGKYRGHMVLTVWMVDPKYVRWLADEAMHENQREIFQEALDDLIDWDKEQYDLKHGIGISAPRPRRETGGEATAHDQAHIPPTSELERDEEMGRDRVKTSRKPRPFTRGAMPVRAPVPHNPGPPDLTEDKYDYDAMAHGDDIPF